VTSSGKTFLVEGSFRLWWKTKKQEFEEFLGRRCRRVFQLRVSRWLWSFRSLRRGVGLSWVGGKSSSFCFIRRCARGQVKAEVG